MWCFDILGYFSNKLATSYFIEEWWKVLRWNKRLIGGIVRDRD